MRLVKNNLSDVLNIQDVGCYITTANCANAPTQAVYYILSFPSNTVGEHFLIAISVSGTKQLYFQFVLPSQASITWYQLV